MANVINRTTKQYLKSVNTPDYPEDEWIINPDLPNCDPMFWVIDGDSVREMTTKEKAKVLPTAEEIDQTRWEGLRMRVNAELDTTSWYMLPDSNLTESQQAEASEYRLKLMNLKTDYPNIDDAIAAFESIVSNKHQWVLW